jgi:hypothetical protein
MTDLSVALPNDAGGRYFEGVARRMPQGSPDPADDSFARVHTILYDALGRPMLVAIDLDSGAGTAYRTGMAILVPASGGPAVVPGDATNGLTVQVAATTSDARIGALTETAPTNDTNSSGLNGRLQRVAQRLTSLIALLPAALGAGGGLKVDGSGTALPVSGTVNVTSAALTPTHSTATATTTTGAMLASNGSRKYALLVNDGSVDVYLKIGASAVANQGIRLLANGGNYEISAALGNLFTGAINGITATGSATVLVTEGT